MFCLLSRQRQTRISNNILTSWRVHLTSTGQLERHADFALEEAVDLLLLWKTIPSTIRGPEILRLPILRCHKLVGRGKDPCAEILPICACPRDLEANTAIILVWKHNRCPCFEPSWGARPRTICHTPNIYALAISDTAGRRGSGERSYLLRQVFAEPTSCDERSGAI